jgi:hypothetical protein
VSIRRPARPLWITLVFVAFGAVGAVRSDEPATSNTIPYRRVLAPADRKQDWPFPLDRYLPIEPEEFERVVKQVTTAVEPNVATAVAETRLTGRFDGPDRIAGRIEMTIRPTQSGAQRVPLSHQGFVISNASWREKNRPAIVGVATDGTVEVWVDEPGVLVADWTLIGRVDDAGAATFDVVSPAAAVSSFELTMPAGYELQAPGVFRERAASGTAKASADVVETLRQFGPQWRLRIVAVAEDPSSRRLPLLRQDTTYEYSERGVEATVQLRIDAVAEPLARLEFDADPTLTIVDVRRPDRRPNWFVTPAAKAGQPNRVTIELDPPLFGTNRTVLVRALAPAQIGKRHNLPSIHCPGLDWQQGTMSLAVAAPLTIDRIDPTHCTSGTPAPLAGSRTGEAVEFTCFDPKASVRVLVARAKDSVEATSVAAVTFGKEETTVDYRADLRVSGGERFLLQAGIPTHWIVDAVTSNPPEALSDWTLSDVRDQRRWLTLRLAESLKPGRPLRLNVAARSKRSRLGADIEPDELRIVEFREARVDAPAVAVRADAAWRLELETQNDDVSLSVDRLDPLRRELLGDFRPQYLLDLRAVAAPWQLKVERREPRVEADLHVAANAAGDTLTERYSVRLTNRDDRPLERVTVRIVPARKQSLTWSLQNDRRGRIDARRVVEPSANAEPSATTADGAAGERWEIAFQQPIAGEVTLEAMRRSPFGAVAEIALPAVVNAVTQRGTVTIESEAALPIAIDRATLQPTAVVAGPDVRRVVRGEFRFEPAQATAAEVPARPLIRRLPADRATPGAVVWNARLQTALETDGRLTHRARLRVQSFGAESFRWTFPTDAERIVVTVDGSPLAVNTLEATVTLPSRSEFATVLAEFETQPVRTGPLDSLAAVPITIDIPLLHLDRDLLLPPQYRVVSDAVAGPIGREPSTLATIAAPFLRQATGPTQRLIETVEPAKKANEPASIFAPWQAARVRFAPGLPTGDRAVWAVRQETVVAVCFAIAAAAATWGYRRGARGRLRFWIALAVVAAASSIVPLSVAMLLFWGLVGLAAAVVLELMLPSPNRKRSARAVGLGTQSQASAVGSAAARAAAPLALLVVGFGSAFAAAAEPAAAPSLPVPSVFIPIDDEGKPTRERYQVPERLWKALMSQLARSRSALAGEVLTTRAEFDVTIAYDPRRGHYAPSEIRGVWNLFATAAGGEATIAFPDFAAASTAVLLDGRLADAARTADGMRWRLTVEKAGPHRVEVIVRPSAETPFTLGGFTWSIGRVLDAQLRLTLPPDLNGLVVAGALEPIHYANDRRTATVRLGADSQLSVAWREGPAAPGAVEFAQYEWWKVRPGTVTVDLQLRVQSKFASGREIVLVADPRLQWIPRRGTDEAVEVVSTPIVVEQATVGQRLRLTLPKSLQPNEVIEASFILNGATGIGRLRLPELRLEPAAVRRVFAVSIDPALDHTASGTRGLTALAAREFEKLWGATAASPQAAYDQHDANGDWSLTTRPKPARLTADENQTLFCGRRRIDVAYEAAVSVTGDAVTRHEVAVPNELEVESISVLDAEQEEQVLRWARDDAGVICVFLRSAVRGSHQLSLRGRLNVPKPGEAAFPFVSLRSATGTRNLRVVRLPDAVVKLRELKQVQLEKFDAASDFTGLRGRLDSVLRVTGATPSAKLVLQENSPRVTAQVVSTLRRDAQNWEFDVVAKLQVGAGLLDEIRLELPDEIATPLTVTPAMPYEVATARDGSRRYVVLRPHEAVRNTFQFALRARVPLVDPTHAVPAIRVIGAESAEYYFQLPARSGLNRVGWNLEQLAPAEIPEGFAKPATDEVLTYRAIGPLPRAYLRDVRRGTGSAFVRLADHFVRTSSGGDTGVSNWLVEPAGATEFALQLPAGARLLHVRVGGADVDPQRGDDGRLRIAAASDQMPHLVEAAYQTAAQPSAPRDAQTLDVPQLIGLNVERSLWTIERLDAATPWIADTTDATSAVRVQLDRMHALDAVLREFAAEEGLGITGRWAEPIAARRRRLRAAMQQATPPVDESERREWQMLLETNAAATSPASKNNGEPGGRVDLDRVWQAAAASDGPRTYRSTMGHADVLVVRDAEPTWLRTSRRLLWPAAFVLLSIVGYFVDRCDGWLRWPRLFGIVAAAAWCVWLQPAAVGWGLMAVMAACEYHSSLRRARERRTSYSAVLRPGL